ncbi:hypothetical protein ABZ926_14620 [Streptomyces litmocidini]|uniref:hypothetical protein n=1 Tax=Streptomyces litmocidini TaxID=67318 RepID=UPI00340C6BAC
MNGLTGNDPVLSRPGVGREPTDVFSRHLNCFVLAIKHITGLLKRDVDLIECVIIRVRSSWTRQHHSRSDRFVVSIQIRAQPSQLRLQLADLARCQVRHLLCFVPLSLGSRKLQSKIFGLLLSPVQSGLSPLHFRRPSAAGRFDRIKLPGQLSNLCLRLTEQSEQNGRYLKSLQPGLLTDLERLTHTIELFQRSDRALLRFDKIVSRAGRSWRGGRPCGNP